VSPADASHLVIASAIIGAILLGALFMIVDAHRHPFCKECYHCLKAKADSDAAAADRKHREYHRMRDRQSCTGRECPVMKKKKR
jgi:hypothetical protein